jgi:AMP nucleosidase
MTDVDEDGARLPDQDAQRHAASRLLDGIEAICDAGSYAEVEVLRPWSGPNPRITGEFSSIRGIRWYLERELAELLARGASVHIRRSRPALDLADAALFAAVDEGRWDLRSKKLFLFGPERVALSLDRLAHYTGTRPEAFQRYVLFTNYAMHIEAFREQFPDAEGPDRPGRQMPAWHHEVGRNEGVSIVNIGVGPSNAKTITDHVGVLRPDALVMIGHCGGLRNHQDIGDFVLATAYLRGDHVLDDVLPTSVPVTPSHYLNRYLLDVLIERGARFRLGTVYTTDNRNWEFNQRPALEAIQDSRSVAVDMESATIATNGFRYRMPNATLLCVSDKPLHGQPKLSDAAAAFYDASRRDHLAIALDAIDRVRREHPGGVPAADIRSADEPLFGTPIDLDAN